MSLPRKNLAKVDNYVIDQVSKDKYTHIIQISNGKNIIAELPLDPLDHTQIGKLEKKNITETLGADGEKVLQALSKALEKIGGKEFIQRPKESNLPSFTVVEDEKKFTRLRQAQREDVAIKSKKILDDKPQLTEAMNSKVTLVVGITQISKELSDPYQNILDFMLKNAGFTESKMREYKEQGVEGIKARYHNQAVTAVALLDQNHQLVGILRCLSGGFGYASDETIDQNILPLNEFEGSTDVEKFFNRGKFLLAYFANAAIAHIKEDQLVIIAAEGRENIYESIGFCKFPIASDDYVVSMRLSPPGNELIALKEQILKPFSNAKALGVLGVSPRPSPKAIENNKEEVKFEMQSELRR